MKYRRLIPLSLVIALTAIFLLLFKVGFPRHRAVSLTVFLLSWIPLIYSYRLNRRRFRARSEHVRRKTRPLVPHAIAAIVILSMGYVIWVLLPMSIETNLVGTLFLFMPFCIFALVVSWEWVLNSWTGLEGSPDPGGLPRYPIKTMVLVSFALLILQGVAEVIRQIAILRGHDVVEEEVAPIVGEGV